MTANDRPGPVRVRFAPSPTGALHLGSALVALANAAYAAASGGVLVLRIDDTDVGRSRIEDTSELQRLLAWLGIAWHEGPVHQRRRGAIYDAALDRLVGANLAYPCFCGDARLAELRAEQEAAGLPPRYDGRCRALDPVERRRQVDVGAPHVLRLAIPEARDVEFDDLVRGRVQVPAGSFGDPVLRRSDGRVGYLLASVVDDIEVGITHVIRGEDHLTNTARHILLHEALTDGANPPMYAHLPLLRDEDGRKLSKRDPLGSLDELVDEGFLPVSVRRYLCELLGHGPVDLLDGEHELDLSRIPTGAPRVDRTRLESLGREDMSQLPLSSLLDGSGIRPDELAEPIVRELATQCHSRVHLRGELRLVFDGPGTGDLPYIRWFAGGDDPAPALELVLRAMDDVDASPTKDPDGAGPARSGWVGQLLGEVRSMGREAGLDARGVFLPLRLALTGTPHGPALPMLLAAIGPDETRARVERFALVAQDLAATGGGEVGPPG